jgi:lysyl-tRNA synthetase class 2
VQPTFIYHFPTEVSPCPAQRTKIPKLSIASSLHQRQRDRQRLQRAGDPTISVGRFVAQVEAKKAGDEEAHDYDADYIRALEYGLPPTAGEGHRHRPMVMLLTDSASILDVNLFPSDAKGTR